MMEARSRFSAAVKNENRMLLVVRGSYEKEPDIRKTIFDYFTKPPVMTAENPSGDSVELIYELDRRSMRLVVVPTGGLFRRLQMLVIAVVLRLHATGNFKRRT